MNIHKLSFQTEFLSTYGDPVVKSPKVCNSLTYFLLPHVILLQWQCMICFAKRKFDRSSIAAHLIHHKMDIVEYEADFGGPGDHEELILTERTNQSPAPVPANPLLSSSQTPLRSLPSNVLQTDLRTANAMSEFSETSCNTPPNGLSRMDQETNMADLNRTIQSGLTGTSQYITTTGHSDTPLAVLSQTRQYTTIPELGTPSVVHTQTSQGTAMPSRTNWRTPSVGHSGDVRGVSSSQSWMDIPPFNHPVCQLRSTSSSTQAPPIMPTSEESLSYENGE